MAEIVVMPQQGNSVESVFLLTWKVAEGDTCSAGDILCEVETDKATMEVESTAEGTVLALLAKEGDEVTVKAPIVVVGAPGEDYSAVLGDIDPVSTSEVQETPPLAPASGEPKQALAASPPGAEAESGRASSSAGAVSPRARLRAQEKGIDPVTLAGSGPEGRVIERDVINAASATTAAATGATGVVGTAIGGRIGVGDIRSTTTAPPTVSPAEQVWEDRPVRGVRKITAERMLASLTSTAQLTLHRSADARALERLRARLKATGEPFGLSRVNLNDLVMFAVSRTLLDYPSLNAHFLGDKIREFGRVDLGFAVDTERGLLVPTLTGADQLSAATMSREIKRIAEICHSGKAGPEELSPATFTVTNLGAFGIESFTPVLNPPQVAILGVSAITLQAQRGEAGSIEHIPSIGLSLTIDHQAVDGAPASRFLAALAEKIAAIDVVIAI